jgi:hypothetical protein
MQLRQEIETLVNERFKNLSLEEKLRLLDSVPGPKKLGRPIGSTNKPSARKQTISIDTLIDEILSIVKENPGGVNSEFLQQQTEQDTKVVAKAVSRMLETNLLRKEGKLRGTKYFPALPTKPPATFDEPPVSARQVEMPIPAPPKGGVPGPNGVLRRKKKRAA